MKSKKFALMLFLPFSALLVAYGPMVSYSSAQAANDAKLQELKEKAVKELDRRIARYEKTLASLESNVHFSKEGSTASIATDKGTFTGSVEKNCVETPDTDENQSGGSVSVSASKDSVNTVIALPCGVKEKVVAYLEKMIEQLTQLKEKVLSASSLSEMRGLAQNIDAQSSLGQLTNVQALVTQAIESMTGVLDTLKSAFTGLKSQVGKIKECAKSVAAGETSVEAQIAKGDSSVSCKDFQVSSTEVADRAQSQLDNMSTILSTISSVLLSSVSLLTSLLTSFSSLLGGLGGLDSLGNLGNLGNLLNTDQLSSLTGSLGSVNGLLGSFSAITSQLDIASLMSGGSLGSLSSLTGLLGSAGLPF